MTTPRNDLKFVEKPATLLSVSLPNDLSKYENTLVKIGRTLDWKKPMLLVIWQVEFSLNGKPFAEILTSCPFELSGDTSMITLYENGDVDLPSEVAEIFLNASYYTSRELVHSVLGLMGAKNRILPIRTSSGEYLLAISEETT